MKPYPTLFLPTLLLIASVLIAAGFGIASSSESSATDNATVLGIHHHTLKEGVSAQEFERFVAEELTPLVNERMPFTRWMVMKGNRGDQVGHYISVYELNSVYLRDSFWNQDGSQTELFQEVYSACGECDDLWNRFLDMTEETEYTDYVEVR
jgi:hypothetical protein